MNIRPLLFSTGLLLLVCASLCGCGSTGEFDPETLRLYMGEEAQNLDPAFAVDEVSGVLTSLIYPGLFRFSPAGEPIPDLARNWTLSEDGTRYTFHLATDRYFDNGSRIDAAAVSRCFHRLLDPSAPSPRRWVLERLSGAEAFREGFSETISGLLAPDDSTVVLELGAPFSPFLGLLAMPATRIYPAGHDGEPLRNAGLPICGGPWRLERWERGERWLLERRGEPASGEFRRLDFRLIPQSFTAVAEFEVGNLDLLRIPLAEADYWREGDWGDQLLTQEELVISYIGLNLRRPPFDDHRVRQAMNLAIDVEALIRTVRGGTARRALGPVPPSLRSSDPSEIWRYRPEEARRLLTEAGYGEGLEIEIWQKENPEVSRLLEAVQAYLAEVGIAAKIVVRDWGAFKDAINRGSADAFFLDWLADYPDAENFLVPLFHSSNQGGGGNRCGFNDSYVDLLLDELQRSREGADRKVLVDRLNETLYRSAPWVWLWHPVSLEVLRPGISGYESPVIFNAQDYLRVRRDG